MGNYGKSVGDMEFNPASKKGVTEKLMTPNAQEDQEAVTGNNPQKAWIGSGGKPSGPFGPKGRNF